MIRLLALAVLLPLAGQDSDVLDGESWRRQALTDFIPHWLDRAVDREKGGFHTNLSRSWEAGPPWEKIPAMLGRQVYGFTAAYLLSGEDKYLDAARQGVDFMLDHCWDRQYGCWYGTVTRAGQPAATEKDAANQLYADVGLTMYYFATGDERAIRHAIESVRTRRAHARVGSEGYAVTLNRDLSIRNDQKIKHAHYGYVGSLLLNLYMAIRDPETLAYAEELMRLTHDHMRDKTGWLSIVYDRDWKVAPNVVDGKEVVPVGAQLTAALAILRLYWLTGREEYRRWGTDLSELTLRCAWDAESGRWSENVQRAAPHAPQGIGAWWIQAYGSFLLLRLHHLTGEKRYLDQFRKNADFWNRYFVDRKFGGTFLSVRADGSPDVDVKAVPWKTSYHEMEHSLLNYLLLELVANRRPATLRFRFVERPVTRRFYVSMLEDPAVRISAVKVDGKDWPDFDANERSILLPAGKEAKVEVTFIRTAP